MQLRSNRHTHAQNISRSRVQIVCPVCHSRCLVSSSQQQTQNSRTSYVDCSNSICGWSGVAITEIVRTISPTSRFYPDDKQPPPIDGELKKQLLEKLSEQQEQTQNQLF